MRSDCSKEPDKQKTAIGISKGADEVYFLLSCGRFLSVDGCHESVVLITCDKDVQKRNCIVLLKFNCEFKIAATTVLIVQKLICTVFVVKHGKSVIIAPIPK